MPRHRKNNEHLHQLQQHLCSGIHKRNRSLDRFFIKEDKRGEAVAIAQRVDEYGGMWLEVLDEQEASNDEHIGKCSLVELVKVYGCCCYLLDACMLPCLSDFFCCCRCEKETFTCDL